MELWIRTQDRKGLFKVKAVYARGNSIIGTVTNDGNYVLGQYETEERAIEILNDIQTLLLINANYKGEYEKIDLELKSAMVASMYKIYGLPEK